jgi:MoaA/NifB/PqqE/SkfB family radical SAM enzyme
LSKKGIVFTTPKEIAICFKVNPFLHFKDGEIYNPLSDSCIKRGDIPYDLLLKFREEEHAWESLPPETKSELVDHAWIVPSESDVTSRFCLKYAAIETHSICNHACHFCPVSLSPREPHFMPTDLFGRIIEDLANYKKTLKGVFLNNYNEPILDERIIDQIETIKNAGLKSAILSNGTELSPEKVDAFEDLGGLGYLAINIASIKREEYMSFHGKDDLDKVLRHLDYAKDRDVADRMAIVVLGDGSSLHQQNYEAICERFGNTRFEIRFFTFVDRAGYLDKGLKPKALPKKLCGCEEMGSRPLQHILINSSGKCIFCCQDYEENYIVGDLNQNSIGEVLGGTELSKLRAYTYGLEEAPADYICRKCVFALTC